MFGVLRHAEKTLKNTYLASKKASVCTIKTSPCMPAPRAHVLKHVRVVLVHGDVLNPHTRRAGGHRQFCLPKFAHVWLSRASEVHQRNFWIFPIFMCENRLRRTCPQFLQSFASPDKAVQFQPS